MVKLIKLKKNVFSSGKIAVKFSRLYGEDKLNELSNLSFDEILKFLEENDFKRAVDTSFLKLDGFYLIERVLNVHLSRIYSEVFSSTKGNNKKLLEAYYLKYQIHNLMALIRCKLSNEKEFESFLIGDERKKEKFIKAYSMPKLEDSIIYISKKIGFDSEKVIENYKHGVYYLENYLYKEYYLKLSKLRFLYNGMDEKKFFSFIRTYIDLLNMRSFLRIKIDDLNSELNFEDIFIIGGNLDLKYFNEIKGKSIKDLLKIFNDEFGNIELCEDNSCIASLDKRIGIHKKESNEVLKFASFGSPFYTLKYLFEMEQEISKLRILLKTKYLDLNEKDVEDLI